MIYNVALIGYGYWGPKLGRNFYNSSKFKIKKIVDLSNKNLLKAKKDFGNISTSKNYKNIRKDCDLVVIATNTQSHFKLALYFLKRGFNILVEKPLCLKLSQIKILEKVSIKNKCKIFVDYPFIFSGSIKFIKKIIDRKKYGKLLRVESYREQAPIRKDVNVIWDLAVHDISILYYLLKQSPKKISSTKLRMKKNKMQDSAQIQLSYPNQMEVFIKTSWISPEKIRLMKFKFEKADIICDENEPIYKIKLFVKSKNSNKYKLLIPELDLNEPLSNLVKYIYKNLKSKINIFDKLNLKITQTLEKI